jgi:hypothetical protein
LEVGAYNGSYLWNGYLRDVNLLIGTDLSSVSTATPTEAVTTTSETSLLTCHLPYITDGSSNDHSITVNGDVSTKPFSPYDYDEYDAADHGGSVYFDGTGDYLAMPVDDDFQFGTGDFTIEMWAKVLATSIDAGRRRIFIQKNTQSASSIFEIIINTDGTIQAYNAADILASTTSFANGSWGHIAFVRDNGTLKVYINGKLENSVSNTTNFSPSSPNPVIGIYPHGGVAKFHGYISDFKITKSVEYTSNFTPPTAPLSSTGSELHIKGTDASIIDKSQSANLELVNTTGSTTRVKFANTKSIYTGGNSSATIRLDASNKLYDLSYGEGDFTVEGWFYTTDNTNNPKLYIDISSASDYWQLYYISGSGITLRANNTGIYSIETGNSFTENTWHHIALCRSGSNYKVFHNGTEIINVTSTHQIGSNSTKTIGGTDISTGNNLRGYIQDFRITKGLARYTANFTPPTAPLKG